MKAPPVDNLERSVRRLVSESRAEQGLSECITDPVVLAVVVSLVTDGGGGGS